MAKPKTNLIIDEGTLNLLKVWTLDVEKAKKHIEAIEGIIRVWRNPDNDCLNVWFNPCYSKAEIKAEIRAALSGRRQLNRPSYQERLRRKRHRVAYPQWPKRTIADMRIGEVGYIVSWAVGNWSGSETLGGLNLGYRVHARKFGMADTPICRTETGWVVGGKVFTEPK